jgi:uncharacterized protein
VTYLPDINVWLALAFNLHSKFASARTWFDALPIGSRCDFCRYTQMGFLRLSSNSKSNPLQTRTMIQAWDLYEHLILDPRVGFRNEPSGLEELWQLFSQRGTFSHNVWNDAFLAAFAQAAGLEVVTFDQGFNQFAGLQKTVLI